MRDDNFTGEVAGNPPAADDGIPPFLDQTNGMTLQETLATGTKARKNAERSLRVRKIGPTSAPRQDNLTDADKAAIKALKKAGADKVPAVRQVGAKLKSETQPKESDVSKTKTKKTARAKARSAVKPEAKTNGVRPGSKLETIVGLLKRPEGCTTKDVLEATGWPAVSMPQQAKAAGLTLKKEKDGSVSRYRAA